jgi:hypothetical protein
MLVLFNGATTDGTSAVFPFGIPNGKARIKMWGTWDGATMELQVSTPPQFVTAWLPCYDGFGELISHTANIASPIYDYISSIPIRAKILNAGASTNLNCVILQCDM